jgi:exosortase/archaeosortase family protein
MLHPLVVSLIVAVATWDGWSWYANRVWASPEEAIVPIVIVAFMAAVGLLDRTQAGIAPAIPVREVPLGPVPLVAMPLGLITVGLAAYALSFAVLPPIARAAVAVALTLYCLHCALLQTRPPIAFWGAIALALPVLPSLQFVFGYPMRLISAALTVALLQAQGLVIRREGTFLVWRDQQVQFDAPCSGISMLWASLLLTFMVCMLFRFGIGRTLVATIIAIVLALAGNVLRASSLFYVEAGFIADAPPWWHDAIGLAAFAISATATVWLTMQLRAAPVPAWAR